MEGVPSDVVSHNTKESRLNNRSARSFTERSIGLLFEVPRGEQDGVGLATSSWTVHVHEELLGGDGWLCVC